MLNLLVRHSLSAQEHDFHLQLHEGMRVVKAPIAQSFNSFRAPRQFEHVKTSGSKLTMQLHFYQKFSKVSSCPARSIVAGGSFVVLLWLELTRKEPLIDLRLYKNLAFTAVSLAVLLNAMNFWGTNFLQTILLQRLMDYTPAQAGYAVLPGALGMASTTP